MTQINEQTKVITDVISVWGWHLLAWMFFLKSIGFLIVKELQWFFGLIMLFVICEVVSLVKKWRVEKETSERKKGGQENAS